MEALIAIKSWLMINRPYIYTNYGDNQGTYLFSYLNISNGQVLLVFLDFFFFGYFLAKGFLKTKTGEGEMRREAKILSKKSHISPILWPFLSWPLVTFSRGL